MEKLFSEDEEIKFNFFRTLRTVHVYKQSLYKITHPGNEVESSQNASFTYPSRHLHVQS